MTEPTVPIRTGPPAFAYLIVTDGDQAGEIVQLLGDLTTIGRAPSSSLRLRSEERRVGKEC